MAQLNHSKNSQKISENSLTQRINNNILSLALPKNGISKAMNYALLNPGKRVRPILLYLVADALNLDLKKIDAIALSIELIHTYSLIHDDLPCMDDDDFRRGQQSLHKKFSESTAVLSGDAMQSEAFKVIAENNYLNAVEKVSVISELAEVIGANGMILGQYNDILFETTEPTKNEILEMARLKTSLLIEFCILCPVKTFAGLNEAWLNLARSVGEGFQLVDDLLDLSQTSQHIGKTAKKDLMNNKKTFPIYYGKDATKVEIDKRSKIAKESLIKLGFYNCVLSEYIEKLFHRTN